MEGSPSVLQPPSVDGERISIPISSLLGPADDELSIPKAEDTKAEEAADEDENENENESEMRVEMEQVENVPMTEPVVSATRPQDEDEDYDT